MPINFDYNTFGNFTPYSKQEIISFLDSEYGLKASVLKIFNNAMDNTVIDIDNHYILKIYETKTPSFVKSSIINYKKFRDFYCINLIANKKNNDICFFKFKPTILYKKALGIFTNELSSLI